MQHLLFSPSPALEPCSALAVNTFNKGLSDEDNRIIDPLKHLVIKEMAQ
jgi:hypothetical protein